MSNIFYCSSSFEKPVLKQILLIRESTVTLEKANLCRSLLMKFGLTSIQVSRILAVKLCGDKQYKKRKYLTKQRTNSRVRQVGPRCVKRLDGL